MRGGRNLRAEDRDDAGERAGTEAGHDAGDEDEVGALRGGLQGAAEHCEERADEDAVDAPDAISHPATCETADNGTELLSLW